MSIKEFAMYGMYYYLKESLLVVVIILCIFRGLIDGIPQHGQHYQQPFIDLFI
jgi:hypothetical protein